MRVTAFKEWAGAMGRLQVLVVFFALTGVFLAGFLISRWLGAPNERTPERRILYYVDPMNPTHTSDKPGLAPCGMNMEPVYADGEAGTHSGAMGLFLPPGTVKISPEKQQLIGVRLTQATVASETPTLRALGRVAADENAVYRVLAPSDGYLRGFPNAAQTGAMVHKDQLLASYFSTEPLAAQQAYLLAIRTVDRRRTEPAFEEQTGLRVDTVDAQLLQAEENLRLAGFSETQIRELARTRQFIKSIELRAPVAGVVIARNLSPYSRFEKNTEFYRIVDLTRVWVLADVFDYEEKFVKPGTTARIILRGHAKVLKGKVSDALAQFDPNSRTYKVRLNVDNPELILRPDAIVDVEFSARMKPAITLPREAVLDSGLRKVVYVDLGNGLFEPRKVETGWSFGDRVEITGGLMPGERVVSSGNFLIDSESRMKLAASGASEATSRDPVCRMEISQRNAESTGLKSEFEDTTYYFCSPECKKAFEADPGHYATHQVKTEPQEMGQAPHQEHSEVLSQPNGPNASMTETRSESKTAPGNSDPGHMTSSSDDSQLTHSHAGEAQLESKATHVDPVCGEEVEPAKAESAGNTSELQGVMFYFSDRACKQVFDMHPERFIGKMSPKAPQQSRVPAPEHTSHGMGGPGEMKQ